MVGRFIRTNILAALFAIIFVGPIAWLAMDREPPIAMLSGVTVPPELQRKEPFSIDWKMVNLPKFCPGTVYFSMKDSKGNYWVEAPAPASFGMIKSSAGESSTVSISGHMHIVPPRATSGTVEIHIINDFVCNWTHYFWPIRLRVPVVYSTIVD